MWRLRQSVARRKVTTATTTTTITLDGKPQWELNREFHEMYCAHVIRWFEANGASLS